MEQELADLEHSLIAYVEKILGVRLRLEPLKRQLPFLLEARYHVRRTWLLGHELLLCFTRGSAQESPGDLGAGAQALQESLGAAPVFVFASLSSWDRDRLIRRHVAFIVPGAQLFLPRHFVDLREKFRPQASPREELPWLGQVILIRHLLKESLEGETVRSLSRRLGYPASSLSRAVRGLEACGLILPAKGKIRPLAFAADAMDLWRLARPRLRSPVVRRHYCEMAEVFESWPVSGEEAVGVLTTVSAREERCRAVLLAVVRQEVASRPGDFRDHPRDAAGMILESWAYDPRPLASGKAVDPCSLSLIYADESDERIQAGLERAVRESLRR